MNRIDGHGGGPTPPSLEDALDLLEAAIARLERVTDRLEARMARAVEDAPLP